MKRHSLWLIIFSASFAVLLISPALLSSQFPPYPLMKVGDVFDTLTPLILIPIYWILFHSRDQDPGLAKTILFLVLAGLWMEGQGMHLSANSIGHLLEKDQENVTYALTLFYDEVLSHYLWHGGIVGLSALLIWQDMHSPVCDDPISLLEGLAGFIYGFVFFIIVVEAGTAPLGVTFALLVVVFSLIRGWKEVKGRPIWRFFFASYLIATILFAIWAIYWGGLPEFSEVGIID